MSVHEHVCMSGSLANCESRGFCRCECGATTEPGRLQQMAWTPPGTGRPLCTPDTPCRSCREWDARMEVMDLPPAAPETILQEAQRLVHGDRGAAYNHPAVDYGRTGRIWGAILGLPDIDPRICCLMMAGVKISREVNAHRRDNLTDLAGYAECASMVAERQTESKQPPPLYEPFSRGAKE